MDEDIRIPKHVEEKDAILGLYKLEWLAMVPFVGAAYGVARWVAILPLKAILLLVLVGAPWHFMAQRGPSGRRNAVLIAHRFRAGRRQHVFRAVAQRGAAIEITEFRERESERARSNKGVATWL